ncbi:aminodeoxychorismate synthase component I [Wenzhouxiangella sp. XN79A]|uniref:aminodeoxychorismate synthase component I n=1 Tax=Wenzhouxiangella sp. XN79A TaxID=2724193 RepID=UPI00144A7476|nr:aminodeoxychorismate synthase component I [Wenzhouxiangella sp. XN79A]NKI34482.1 aminodeoxychorismate synthase component I [Wenzhouxiangella sp. XN79A]
MAEALAGSAPDPVALHRANPDAWPFLLHTASPGARSTCSLLLFADPATPPITGGADRLAELEAAWQRERRAQPDDEVFAGGWFVYLGYETAAAIEPTLSLPRPSPDLPDVHAQRCRGALVLDHAGNRARLVGETPEVVAEMRSLLADKPPADPSARPPELAIEVDDGTRFEDGVRRIREYILAGDVFQVNLSRGWRARAVERLDPVALYRRLAEANPAPFAGLARLPGGSLLSSSPERLVASRDGRVDTRPIAGTRPRGTSPGQDRALSDELIAHPKERAEHVMLIDLERNDLGRVCVPGSVRVDELMVIESYAHVHHIVSNVTGRLAPDASPVDVIRAVFPGGTITGCPKIRCMEIIAELEQVGRGAYTGSMGYLGLDGRLDLNILIRSMWVTGPEVHFRTGAGIVADSIPSAELAETEAKARGLLRALEP